mgnify:CR=1 FL=1
MKACVFLMLYSFVICNPSFSENFIYQESDFSKKVNKFKNKKYDCSAVDLNTQFFEQGLEKRSTGDGEWYYQVQSEFANKCTKEFVGLLLSYDKNSQYSIAYGLEDLFMTEELRLKLKKAVQESKQKSNLSDSLKWILKD